MNTFRTEYHAIPSPVRIHHGKHLATIGSCFAQSMGDRFQSNKFTTLSGIWGNLYSPLAIHDALAFAIGKTALPSNTYVQHQEVWYNFHFHSQWCAKSQPALEQLIADRAVLVHDYLQQTDVLIITYGTAKIWQHRLLNIPVANCHKVTSESFSTFILTPEAMMASFSKLYQSLKEFRPGLHILLTVSPVRHTRDTLPVSALSKAALRWGCQQICDRFADVSYFPAFEIMLDDLRDYRFYQKDMIHPSDEALEYVWSKFQETYFDNTTVELLQSWHRVSKSLAHRPFHDGTKHHRTFLQNTLRQLEALLPFLSVQDEIDTLQRQIISSNNTSLS